MRTMTRSMCIVLAVVCGVSVGGWAQKSDTQQASEKREPAYHLDFSISEIEDGKKINVRHYSTNLTGGNAQALKIGTRVPIESEAGKFQYLDIGTNIRAKTYGTPELPILEVSAEISNLVVTDQNAYHGQPTIRQMFISGTPTLTFDKPMIIGSVDDPNSKRQYQLEVTATKLR